GGGGRAVLRRADDRHLQRGDRPREAPRRRGGDARSAPGLPPMRELGSDIGMWGYLWFWGPARMPPGIADPGCARLPKAIPSPQIRELVGKGGSEGSGMPPAEMAREVKRLYERWGTVIREVGVSLEP